MCRSQEELCLQMSFECLVSLLFFETGSCVAEAGLELAV